MTSFSLAKGFEPREKKLLRSGFLDFGDMWNLATRAAKRNLRRVLLPAYVAKLLLLVAGGLGLLLLGGVLLTQVGSVVEVTVGGENYALDDSAALGEAVFTQDFSAETRDWQPSVNEDQLARLIEQNAGQFLGILAAVILTLLALSWLYSYFHLRALQMLGNPEDKTLLATPGPVVLATFRFLALQIFVGIVGSVLQESLAPVVGLDQSAGYAYLWQFVWYSLAGLSAYALVFRGEGILRSVATSYRLSIEVYWANVLRWLLFYVVLWSALILGMVGLAFVLALLLSVAASPFLAGGVALLVLLASVFLGLLVEAFVQVFGWVSYVNIASLAASSSAK